MAAMTVEEALAGLVAKWRSESKELRARADRHSNGEYYAELHSKADALEDRADELSAALAPKEKE